MSKKLYINYNGNKKLAKINGKTKGTFNGVEWDNSSTPTFSGLCFTAEEDSSVTFSQVTYSGSWSHTPVIKYSSDGVVWNDYTLGTTLPLSAGDKLYFKGDNAVFSESHDLVIGCTLGTGKVSASGNIMSLVDSSCESLTIPCDNCFDSLFYNCTSLTTAPLLPATTLSTSCYRSMFWGCTSLITPPELPATTLSDDCYHTMFSDCSSLTTSPILNALTLTSTCYEAMFQRCTSLTIAPALPATTLATECYRAMFSDCTSLTTVPALPATTLATECYLFMFYCCTSLYVSDSIVSGTAEQAWRIPSSNSFTNTTQYDQDYMFNDCLGIRSSNNMSGAYGESHTYYTQNQPVS